MTPERWEQVRVCSEAASPASRRGWGGLPSACLRGGCRALAGTRVAVRQRSFPRPASTLNAGALTDAARIVAGEEWPSLIGKSFGHYTVVSLLGSGGMGEVYCARDVRLGHNVAIKTLPWLVTPGDDTTRQFETEARVVASLSRPQRAGALRCRRNRRQALYGHGTARRRNAARAPRPRTPAFPQGGRNWHGHRRGPRRRSQQGHRAPRSQAGERLHHDGRPRQGAGLRDCENPLSRQCHVGLVAPLLAGRQSHPYVEDVISRVGGRDFPDGRSVAKAASTRTDQGKSTCRHYLRQVTDG